MMLIVFSYLNGGVSMSSAYRKRVLIQESAEAWRKAESRLRRREAVPPCDSGLCSATGEISAAIMEPGGEQGLSFPMDLGARASATLGGNASTNAGGNRAIRCGMTRALVLGLEAAIERGLIADAAIAHSQRDCAAIGALRDDVT